MLELENLTVLVIESRQSMRAQLRTMLMNYQISAVQFASSAGAAIRKLKQESFDLILCNHDLGEGQDGQHLLEDLRTHGIIRRETLFVMISNERNYERVIGTAELAPDDYVLTPLTPSTLLVRLQRILARRDIFLPVWRMLDSGDTAGAVQYCLSNEPLFPNERIRFMRLRAELHENHSEFEAAEEIYRAIVSEKPQPWAQLGIARQLCRQKRYQEAISILESLVEERDYYIEAYDWLTRARAALGEYQQAQEVMSRAVAMSPHRVTRLREYGDVATRAGDYAGAEQSLAEVVRKGKYSDFRNPEDHLRLVKVQLLEKKQDAALATIGDLEKSMPGETATPICASLGRALAARAAGREEEARDILRTTLAQASNNPLAASLKQELVRTSLDLEMDDECSDLVSDLLRTAEDEKTLEDTRALLAERGRDKLSAEIELGIQQEVKALVSVGAAKVQSGDYDGAVAAMMNAARRMPGNSHVLFNAALALLRRLERKGWNEQFAEQARKLIIRCRKLDPTNPKINALTTFHQTLLKKYGIRADANTTSLTEARRDSVASILNGKG